jgi:hypothetical protein
MRFGIRDRRRAPRMFRPHSGQGTPPPPAAHERGPADLQAFPPTGATGLEPATSGVTGRRSNQLSYAPGGEPGVWQARCRHAAGERHDSIRFYAVALGRAQTGRNTQAAALHSRTGMRSLSRIARRRLVWTGIVAAICLTGGVAQATEKPRQRFFETTSGAVECELDDGGAPGIGVDAYCQTAKPPRSVRLAANGTQLSCAGPTCIGNPPLNVRKLKAGSTVSLGPFNCKVGAAAITCRVSRGAGFSVSRAGVVQLRAHRARR